MAKIEVFRTHLPSGEPAPLTTVREVPPEKKGQTMPDAVMNAIRSFNPSRTSQNCVYLFDSPEHGKGKITVQMLGALYRERMDEKVQMLEIERALGRREPGKVSDTMTWMFPIRLQVRNPYAQLLFGLMVGAAAIVAFFYPMMHPDASQNEKTMVIAMGLVLLVVASSTLIQLGMRRLRWWHRARAVVKHRGDKMPSDLQLFP